MNKKTLIYKIISCALTTSLGVTALLAAAPTAPQVPWPPPTETISWQDPTAAAALPSAVTLQVLDFNDFHGNMLTPKPPSGRRPAGGAAVLAAYLKSQRARASGRHADHSRR